MRDWDIFIRIHFNLFNFVLIISAGINAKIKMWRSLLWRRSDGAPSQLSSYTAPRQPRVARLWWQLTFSRYQILYKVPVIFLNYERRYIDFTCINNTSLWYFNWRRSPSYRNMRQIGASEHTYKFAKNAIFFSIANYVANDVRH